MQTASSVPVGMANLHVHRFLVFPDVAEIKFERNGSHKRPVIKRRQVPIEPGFAVTTHKAQGQTMKRVLVDLEGCTGTKQPYAMVSCSTSLDKLIIFCDFNIKKTTKRPPEDSQEIDRPDPLRSQTIGELR